jgi:hypothetical protein
MRMLRLVAASTIVALLTAGCTASAESNIESRLPVSSDEVALYQELRSQVLQASASELQIDLPAADAAWGILMETGYPEGTVTVVGIRDGNASLYFSTGGGIIGGEAHDNVRRAAGEAVRLADFHRPSMSRATSYPAPAIGEVRFFILTDEGHFTAAALEEDLGHDHSDWSPLFHAVHEVIAELIKVADSKSDAGD